MVTETTAEHRGEPSERGGNDVSAARPARSHHVLARDGDEGLEVFEVVARRFAFEPATIEVVEGDRVRLLVRSADGPHGVEIKAFKVKKAVPRAKPGDAPITIEFVATAAGEYPILCSEYCGSGHKEMTGALVVRAKPKGDQ